MSEKYPTPADQVKCFFLTSPFIEPATYTYGLQRISQNLSPAVTGNSTWTPSFYVYDGAGSVRQLTNSAGVVTDEYEYDAYGNSFTKSGTTPNNYLYRGEQYDSDLALYYLRARYYNAGTGRFMSRDPEEGKAKYPASFHKFLYANGDPVNMIDPRGWEAYTEWEGAAAFASLVSELVAHRILQMVCGALFASATYYLMEAIHEDKLAAGAAAGAGGAAGVACGWL
jgi:RHS repeat-associated protein